MNISSIDVSNLPAKMTEPPSDARGWFAWQPSTGKVWRKVAGEWLQFAEAQKLLEERRK